MHPEPIQVLLVEDNLADSRFIEILLRESGFQQYELHTAQTFQDGIDALHKHNIDVLLLDLSLPDSFGLDTIKNANQIAPYVPIIVLTGRNDDDFALEVVKAGAQDYLVKGQIDHTLLSRAIRYSIQRKEMEVHLKEVHKRVEESEEQLNVIVKHNISGIVLLDKDSNIRFVNPAAEKILSTTSDKLMGQHFPYAYTLDSATLVSLPVTESQVEILAAEIVWADQPSILLTLHDITDLKRAEESLLEKNNQLTRINKALDKFVYIVSHDLKKPTANILGLLSLYSNEMQQNASPKAKTIVEKLDYSAQQLKKMIEELLEEARKPRESFEVIDVKKLFSEVESSMALAIEETGAEIRTDFNRCPIVNYNYQDLRSIFSNLLSNAIKYRSPERKAEIEIRTDKTPTGNILTVKDNGTGIDLEKQSNRIFKKYQRFAEGGDGTGLGLWLVKDTVEKNGGHIEVDSTPGKGTTFRVMI